MGGSKYCRNVSLFCYVSLFTYTVGRTGLFIGLHFQFIQNQFCIFSLLKIRVLHFQFTQNQFSIFILLKSDFCIFTLLKISFAFPVYSISVYSKLALHFRFTQNQFSIFSLLKISFRIFSLLKISFAFSAYSKSVLHLFSVYSKSVLHFQFIEFFFSYFQFTQNRFCTPVYSKSVFSGSIIELLNRCYDTGVSRQVDTPRRDVCGPTKAGVHMLAGSADRNGSATSTSEARKRNHYARPGQVSFDERSYKLATLAMESSGRLGRGRSDLIDQVAATIVGGTDASSLARKGVCKERLFQTISVTTQVAISRRVHRYRLSLRDRQAARGREEESGGLRPLAWGGNVDKD